MSEIKTTRTRVYAKQCYFSEQGVKTIDYKDIDTLRKFLNPHGRIIARRRTGVCAKHQRELARAIKRAREMALIPYIVK